MVENSSCFDLVYKRLSESKGVQVIKLLNSDEKKIILDLETSVEDKIAYGMCRTYNEGIREALNRSYTLAMVIDTEVFEYPHHPLMRMVLEEAIMGEQINDPNKLAILKQDRTNFFLWENFVIYTSRLPKDRESRQKLRIIYQKRGVPQLYGIRCVKDDVFGTLSSEGDKIMKEMISFPSDNIVMGTSLIGFNQDNLESGLLP